MRKRDSGDDDACLRRRGSGSRALFRWSAAALALLAVAPAAAQETVTYSYDARGRLIVVDHGATGPNAGHLATYKYDAADNRQNVTGAGGSGTTCTGVTFMLSNAGAVTEGANSIFTITKTGTATTMCAITYSTVNGTATQPGDYITTTGTVAFLPNQISATISVPTTNDSIFESTETFTMSLSAPGAGGHLGSPITATATINDDDAPVLSINDATAPEGSPLIFTVTRSVSSNGTITVQYATAPYPGITVTHWTPTSGTLTFASGETSKTITVTTVHLAGAQGDDLMYLNLSNPTGGAIIGDGQGIGSVTDTDTNYCPGAMTAGSTTDSTTATGTDTSSPAPSSDSSTSSADTTAPASTTTSGTVSPQIQTCP